jgi:hypothetical protein
LPNSLSHRYFSFLLSFFNFFAGKFKSVDLPNSLSHLFLDPAILRSGRKVYAHGSLFVVVETVTEDAVTSAATPTNSGGGSGGGGRGGDAGRSGEDGSTLGISRERSRQGRAGAGGGGDGGGSEGGGELQRKMRDADLCECLFGMRRDLAILAFLPRELTENDHVVL